MAAAAPAQARPASAALYVGDLHPDVNDNLLWANFSDAGLLRSVRVCIDNNTRRSLGYGYVNFVQASDAEKAMETKANMKILDRPIRLMWSQRDPSVRRSGVGNLFVKNLPASYDSKKLHNAFSYYGNILSCKVMTDDKGNSKGFGFVHFESSDAASQAIAGLHEAVWDDQKIHVCQHVSRKSRVSAADTKWTNVFVKNLPGDFEESRLREIFTKYGEITSIFLARHEFSTKATPAETTEPATPAPVTRCYGFINFANHDDAVKAVTELNEHKLDDNTTLFVGRAQTRSERAASLARTARREPVQSNLFVKPLEDGVTDDILEKHFSKFGPITSARVATDGAGQSRGFGYVCFSTAEAAQKAITDAAGHAIPGYTKPLVVCYHEPRTIRSQRIAAQKVVQQQMFPYPPMGAYPPQFYPGSRPAPRSNNARAPHNAAGAGMGPRRPAVHQAVPVMAAAAPAPAPARVLALPSKEELKAMAPAEAQTAIGDYLFNSMLETMPKHNGKITGMLLSMHAADLNGLIELVHNRPELDKHIKEAHDILNE